MKRIVVVLNSSKEQMYPLPPPSQGWYPVCYSGELLDQHWINSWSRAHYWQEH